MKSFVRLLTIILFALSLSAQAGLISDLVDMSVSGVADQNGVLVGGGIEGSFTFGSDESIDIDISNTAISIKVYDFTGFWQWITDPVVITISDLDFGSSFGIVTSEFTNQIGPVTWNFGSDWISVGFNGSVALNDTGVIMDLRADLVSRSVPEPSTLAIFALAMIALASRRFRKQF